MKRKILIWTQHLLGVGHLMRSMNVAAALGQAGHQVILVSGGHVSDDVRPRDFTMVRLPPVRAKDELFDALSDLNGEDVTPALMQQRKSLLLDTFNTFSPDCVITETFPFGRRLVQDELLALIATANALPRRPKLVSSVRDVLQRPRKAERALGMVAYAQSHYDMILVHGDESILPAEAAFPEIESIKHLLRYTGYIGRMPDAGPRRRDEVLVSAGGGAVGDALIRAAVAARALSTLRHLPWTIVTGPLSSIDIRDAKEITFERHLPNLSERLAHAALSVSQAGYNTIVETIAGATPAVVVPFETDREREQITRATCLAARGLMSVVRSELLTPSSLAAAMDERAALGMPSHSINLEGQAGTVTALSELLGES
jgi:predicted glycosyltransferase